MQTKRNFTSLGFWIGFLGTFISTLGLIFRPIEIIAEIFLAPGRFILSPLQDTFANMNGFLNILIMALVNGIIFGLIFWLISKLTKKDTPDSQKNS
jgi:uncharacterized membrane protein